MSGLDVEVLGEVPVAPDAEETAALCRRALAAAGVRDGHVAVTFVDEASIRELNRDHRGRDAATDVLSFPVDGAGAAPGPRELGDVVICPPRTTDLREAVVHGALHLAGLDHETDSGEMLALQAEVLRAAEAGGT
ncbi:MAG: rRNA maturation RNase YbeY [Solirubrobacteraceae bacterium]